MVKASYNLFMDIFNVNPDCLSPQDFEDIRAIAREMFESNKYGEDHFKIAVLAFLFWLTETEKEINIHPDAVRDELRIIH